jgi:phosphatidylglycerophosphate synthase
MLINKSLPNIISLLRVLLSSALLLTLDSDWLFSCLIILIGLTDISDGYIARRFHLVSKLGAKLDSLADLIFFTIILWILYLRYEWILTENSIWFLIIVFLKISTAIISKIKNGEFIFVHTIANKITGLFIFFSILVLPFGVADTLFRVVFLVGTIAATEELAIVIVNRTVDVNQASIFKKTYR